MNKKKTGVTRRVFINQSLGATGGALILANSASWPAWAGEPQEGTFTRMPRMVRDPETKRTWLSFLHVDLTVDEIDTDWGLTRVTEAVDKVLVKFRDGRKFSDPDRKSVV